MVMVTLHCTLNVTSINMKRRKTSSLNTNTFTGCAQENDNLLQTFDKWKVNNGSAHDGSLLKQQKRTDRSCTDYKVRSNRNRDSATSLVFCISVLRLKQSMLKFCSWHVHLLKIDTDTVFTIDLCITRVSNAVLIVIFALKHTQHRMPKLVGLLSIKSTQIVIYHDFIISSLYNVQLLII